jgi:hypothetical protein
MYATIGDIAATLNERGLPISRSTLALYSDPHTLWFKRGQFNIATYQQMHKFARDNGMQDILPPADMVRSFMSPTGLTPEQRCEAELILSETAMRLAAEAQGRTDLKGYEEINKARGVDAIRRQDLTQPFLQALREGQVGNWLNGLTPAGATTPDGSPTPQAIKYQEMQLAHAQMTDPAQRQKARATLAYMRREPAMPDDNLITVNIASQMAHVRINGTELDSRVVIGTPNTQTSGIFREVETGIAQKRWDVPPSMRERLGFASQAPGVDNPLGEFYFKTVGEAPNLIRVHGSAEKSKQLFGAADGQRLNSNGCIRIERIHDVARMALAPDAAQRFGYQTNDELAAKIGEPGNGGRWANTELNNARIPTVAGLTVAALNRPVEVVNGQPVVHGDPYGHYKAYTSPGSFPTTYGTPNYDSIAVLAARQPAFGA